MRLGWFSLTILAISISGCSQLQEEMISKELPVSVKDIEEIRSGDDAHKALFESQNPYQPPKYKLYTSPELQAYVTTIGNKISDASIRPNLPYRFFIIDSTEVNLFGLPGGRVYITKAFFTFIQSESELAGGIAHEVGHIALKHYQGQATGKIAKGYNLLRSASDQTSGFAGTYGVAANTGVKAMGIAGPKIKRQFSGDAERLADKEAVQYLNKAGYDPRGLYMLVDKLSKVSVDDVANFVELMKSHPPFEKRKRILDGKTRSSRSIRRSPELKIDPNKLQDQEIPESALAEVKGEEPPPVEVTRPANHEKMAVVEVAALPHQS